jgi:hypothetical protein
MCMQARLLRHEARTVNLGRICAHRRSDAGFDQFDAETSNAMARKSAASRVPTAAVCSTRVGTVRKVVDGKLLLSRNAEERERRRSSRLSTASALFDFCRYNIPSS